MRYEAVELIVNTADKVVGGGDDFCEERGGGLAKSEESLTVLASMPHAHIQHTPARPSRDLLPLNILPESATRAGRIAAGAQSRHPPSTTLFRAER